MMARARGIVGTDRNLSASGGGLSGPNRSAVLGAAAARGKLGLLMKLVNIKVTQQ